MTRRDPPPEPLSRDESRYLDGELPPDAARRLEHQLAADPERAERLAAYGEAMETLREDADHTTRSVDPRGALADRVLETVTGERPLRRRAGSTLSRWYAAAAALLMAVGVGGTLLARQSHAPAADALHPPELADIEDAVLDLVLESPELAPRLTSLKEGR